MEDFFLYFIAGMIGEELMNKLATRPYGFWILWLIGLAVTSLVIFLLIVAHVITSIILTGGYDGPMNSFSIFDVFHFIFYSFFVSVQPWALLISLVMGFLFAMAYRDAYKNKLKEKSFLSDKKDTE